MSPLLVTVATEFLERQGLAPLTVRSYELTLYHLVSSHPRLNAIVHLLHRTGARIGELLALDLDGVDWVNRKFQVMVKVTDSVGVFIVKTLKMPCQSMFNTIDARAVRLCLQPSIL